MKVLYEFYVLAFRRPPITGRQTLLKKELKPDRFKDFDSAGPTVENWLYARKTFNRLAPFEEGNWLVIHQ